MLVPIQKVSKVNPVYNTEGANVLNSTFTICGYKCFYKEQNITFRPITILSGANSSGKSSIMQPLLLMKQTLESSYDPAGALLLSGPNVRFTSFEQLLSNKTPEGYKNQFSIQIRDETNDGLKIIYKKTGKSIDIGEMIFYQSDGNEIILRENMTSEEIVKYPYLSFKFPEKDEFNFVTERERCFYILIAIKKVDSKSPVGMSVYRGAGKWEKTILEIIHLPGLRGNPERNYKMTAVESSFPGTFEPYVASIINYWQINKDKALIKLGKYMENLGLTWKVEAKQIDDTSVELLVGRLPASKRANSKDMVNIADVGFGVSQVLPVLISLLIAREGQMVYIEQPELHLHPRAQVALAEIISEAAKRGVIVVIETHSPLLLLGIQTLVAEKKLSPELIKLHWFTREKDGYTKINSVDLDEKGAYGNWPEDFGDTSLKLESRYLDASEDWGN